MQEENKRVAIRNLQRYLRAIAYFDERIPKVGIDGVYGPETERAVRAFQQIAKLPVTGTVDQVTWEALYAYYLADQAKHDAPVRISHFPRLPEDYTLEVGEQQFLVSIIQNALRELAVDYDWPVEVPLTGSYDEATASAVRVFQELNGLPATGGVDRATWNALANTYNRTFAGYFPQ
jgi:peptidoglycan hydrolase-like protein with peptidoglycan-binding domain